MSCKHFQTISLDPNTTCEVTDPRGIIPSQVVFFAGYMRDRKAWYVTDKDRHRVTSIQKSFGKALRDAVRQLQSLR
jgi:hypothetical protein